VRFAGGILIVALLMVATAGAHPVSTTSVAITVDPSGTYVATISAEAGPLIKKLEALSAAPLHDDRAATAADRTARLDALQAELLAHVAIAFDAERATPGIDPAQVSDAGQATITLTGRAPGNARTVTWSSSLVFGSYPVAVRGPDGREVVQWLQAQERSQPVALAGAARAMAIWQGLWLGFTHILPNGIDHILFVLGLFLFRGSDLFSTETAPAGTGLDLSPTRPFLGETDLTPQLVAQVSAFTLAHSITLGLSLYGVFSLPPRFVEPMIALSVAYVGVENLVTSRLHTWRIGIVFAFGLLHGLGFADALAALHLSRPDMLSTLISFNAGVEGGQLAVIAIAAVAMTIAARVNAGWRRPLAALSSGAIGLVGLFWTVQRIW
jgi:hypothetical protein